MSKLPDYLQVQEKLFEVGATFHEVLRNFGDYEEHDLEARFYNVNGKGLIVCIYNDGKCGLYTLVGKDGEPVENDLAFIERFAVENSDVKEAAELLA